jgi:LacI family transcriptional regulator
MTVERVTIRDIAKKTGLHFTTVSLALRNSPRLKASTREKIQKLAKKMGYRPDPMLAALNAYRQAKLLPQYQATIAWINNWPTRDHMLSNTEFREYFQGAQERAQERGYVLEEFWLREPGMTLDRFNRILRARNIQGMLIAPQPESLTLLPFNYDELSTVALGYNMRPSSMHVVTNHLFHSMGLLFDHLRALGYRRVGLCVSSNWDEKVENALLGGWVLWNWKNPRQIQMHRYADNPIAAVEKFVQWLKQKKVEVVVSTDDIAKILMARGFKFPETIGYASLALPFEEKYFSGIYQNDKLIGGKAVDLIIGMLNRGERGLPRTPIRTLIESDWCPGQTLRRPVTKS